MWVVPSLRHSVVHLSTRGLRPGLYSYAALRLICPPVEQLQTICHPEAASAAEGLCISIQSLHLAVQLQRHAHRVPNFVHGGSGPLAGLFGTVLQNIPCQPRVFLIFLAALLHGIQNVNQRVGCPTLALDAANPRTATP